MLGSGGQAVAPALGSTAAPSSIPLAEQSRSTGQSTHSMVSSHPVRPYARLVLTVEHDCFVIAPHVPPPRLSHDSDNDTEAAPPTMPSAAPLLNMDENTTVTKAIQVRFKVGQSPNHQRHHQAPTPLGQTQEPNTDQPHKISISSRISYLAPGPHLIVITSVKALGEIEDKPVFAVDKIAVLPMEKNEAIHILNRQALHLDSNTSTHTPELVGEAVNDAPSQTSQVESNDPGDPVVPAPVLVKSPKVRFSFLGIKQEKHVAKSASTPSLQSAGLPLPLTDAASGSSVISNSKRISFDIPALHYGGRSSTELTTVRSEASPSIGVDVDVAPEGTRTDSVSAPSSPTGRSPSPGFFAKLKESILTKPSFGQDSSESEIVAASTTHTAITGVSEDEHEKNKAMDRKVIREICLLFGTGFYFSIEFNLLSSMQKRSEMSEAGVSASRRYAETVPLWKQVDRRFWWNENLLKEFLDIEAHGYILPIMQGYVETEPCEIEEQAFVFTLISRRSKERSGLRYQRRGIDEDGNTANFVETEQLLRIVRDDSDHQVSFVQTRGSIPLFWSQSPYRLKPIPIMERTEQENLDGFTKHVESQIKSYGRQIFISLVEQHGREHVAGSAYTHFVETLAEPNVRYVEFDFHEECKGMKYENIDRLIKNLEIPIQELGYCWLAPKYDSHTAHAPGKSSQNKNLKERDRSDLFQRLYDQKGVIRTNCMDCLDRTNVVQSAIGRHILNHQLLRLGIASFPDKGLSVYEDFENVFNHVWANNGDSISREYAGTSALKGDFTRTGKRNLQGMVNDATNSIARMYQNTFKDYFRQATIDYLLGEAEVAIFKNLQTTPFGTVVVPAPVLPPLPSPSLSKVEVTCVESADVADEKRTTTQQRTVVTDAPPAVLLPSLISNSSSLTSFSSVTDQGDVPSLSHALGSEEEKAIQQETWVRIREAAIETAAEIVISPGEERWKGWTFICCSNEISSALTSSSSPYSSPQSTGNKSKYRKQTSKTSKTMASLFRSDQDGLSENSSNSNSNNHRDEADSEQQQSMFYDEKIVLLTERALYICTYDYEMEKVLEFWRLALEKMTGIDKGAFFITSLDSSRLGQDPLENAGFAVVYRANSEGETLRVNSGSVRNRRTMGSAKQNFDTDLEQVQEENEGDEEGGVISERCQSPVQEEEKEHQENSFKVHPKQEEVEQNDIRSVRFKIVKHPEISVLPYMTSPEVTAAERSKANPVGYKRTAQDCVEWVVTEIVQARCELISVAEAVAKTSNSPTSPMSPSSFSGYETPSPPPQAVGRGRESSINSTNRHGRSPSEEYNYRSPREQSSRRSRAVQVDLVIRDRVLQSLEKAAQLEGASLPSAKIDHNDKDKDKKKSRKTFSSLFSSRDKLDSAVTSSNAVATAADPTLATISTAKISNRSWFSTKPKKEDTLEKALPVADFTVPLIPESELANVRDAPAVLVVDEEDREETNKGQRQLQPELNGSLPRASLESGKRPITNDSSVFFAKIRQAVKNL
ncbi:hypothetical protein BG004_005708 [Podila humilis]|nr:hypothetical protein BG004_005708 [Podila humilis]